jgi:Rrf2 family protein
MNISVKSEYALQAVFDLALQPPGEPVKIAGIARRQKIPQKFLELILGSLKQGGFVESRRGAEGGYRLAKPADQIKVGEVLSFIEERKRTKRTATDPFAMPGSGGCGRFLDPRSHHSPIWRAAEREADKICRHLGDLMVFPDNSSASGAPARG